MNEEVQALTYVLRRHHQHTQADQLEQAHERLCESIRDAFVRVGELEGRNDL